MKQKWILVVWLLSLLPSQILGEIVLEKEIGSLGDDSSLYGVSPDLRYAAIHFPSYLNVYNFQTNRLEMARQILNPNDRVAIAFSPDSQDILIGYPNGFIECFDLQTRQQKNNFLAVQGGFIGAISMAQSNTLGTIAVVSSPSGISVWTYPGFYHVHTFPRPAANPPIPPQEYEYSRERFSLDTMPDGTYAVESDLSLGLIRLFDLQTMNEVPGNSPFFYANGANQPRANQASVFSPAVVKVGFLPKFPAVISISALVPHSPITITRFDHTIIDTYWAPEISNPSQEKYDFSENGDLWLFPDLRRVPLECATLIRRTKTEDAYSPTGVANSTVKISRDGKKGFTLSNDGVLRIWSVR